MKSILLLNLFQSAMDWLAEAFSFRELSRLVGPIGELTHGDGVLDLGESR
jgi:hypothetical protein